MPKGFFMLRSLRSSLGVNSDRAEADAVMGWGIFGREGISPLSKQCNLKIESRSSPIHERLTTALSPRLCEASDSRLAHAPAGDCDTRRRLLWGSLAEIAPGWCKPAASQIRGAD